MCSKTYEFRIGEKKRVKIFCLITLIFLCGCKLSIHDEVNLGNLEKVKFILDNDPEKIEERNEMNKTPLFYAVARGRKEIAELLVERGANVNAQDITGLTPLHVAAWWGREEEADLLLKAGADLHSQDVFGDTPLHVAAMQGRPRMVEFLVNHGADLNVKNFDGRTPLDLAKLHFKEETVKKIIDLSMSR